MAKWLDKTGSAPENPQAVWDNARQRFATASSDVFWASCEEQTFFHSAKAEALHRLMLIAAPSMDALKPKLDIYVDEDCGRLMDLSQDAIMNALKADMKRLSERH